MKLQLTLAITLSMERRTSIANVCLTSFAKKSFENIRVLIKSAQRGKYIIISGKVESIFEKNCLNKLAELF